MGSGQLLPGEGLRLGAGPGASRFHAGAGGLGKDAVKGHTPPAPSLTDALRDVLGPLPPDTADPDQKGVAWLQQVEQGSLQGTVP